MITQINKRIDGLHGVIVKMNQHMGLQTKVEDLGMRVQELEMRPAA